MTVEAELAAIRTRQDVTESREAIRDCLYRYCRGIDRRDADILRTAYWPDANDTHLSFKCNIEEFIAWAMPTMKKPKPMR